MQELDKNSSKEFIGFIWIDDQPGTRLRILARSVSEAKRKVVDEYGEGHMIQLSNEDDASKPRIPPGGNIGGGV